MKHLAISILALALATSCSRQANQSRSVPINTIESVKSQQVIYNGEPWVEVTLSQRVDPKAPAYVVGIRESKWANRLRWALVRQTFFHDTVTSCFRFKPANGTSEILLNRDDFEWYPPVSGFEPVKVALTEAEPSGAAGRRQPLRSETNRMSEAAGSRR